MNVQLEIIGSPEDTSMALDIVRVELVDSEYNMISGFITNHAVLELEQ